MEEINLPADERNYYTVFMECSNCEWIGGKEIPLSIIIANHRPFCPKCYCRTLELKKNVTKPAHEVW